MQVPLASLTRRPYFGAILNPHSSRIPTRMKTRAIMLALFVTAMCSAQEPPTILIPRKPSPAVTLASREVRRYIYIRTGMLAPVVADNQMIPRVRSVIALAPTASRLLANLPVDRRLRDSLRTMSAESFCLHTLKTGTGSILLISGATDIATLYGAYAFAETMGIRFSAHGDDIPDGRLIWTMPVMVQWHTPLFATRGLQPFHDFPEGPDWWNVDDYKALFTQMVKMRMNFFGLHTYPQGGVGPEPTVWIGHPDDVRPGTAVGAAYPARYFTTAGDPAWGYNPQRTSTYAFGCGQYFDAEAYGSEFMTGFAPHDPIGTYRPYPPERISHVDPVMLAPDAWNVLFDRNAALLANAFTFGHDLGIKLCIGTETPLTIPTAVKQRALALGKDTTDRILRRDLYEGMFRRLKQTLPLDHYWFWTPEDWTWSGNNDAHIAQTRADLDAAMRAAEKVMVPFSFATCGWVLGPAQDRAMFDTFLPKTWAMSCINRNVGYEPVDPDFARVSGRALWAIPWLEDDPALLIPQLWAGRVRRDAADALAYGCTGLIGIHWRTRVLSPNIAALAAAGWSQRGWNPRAGERLSAEQAVQRSKDPARCLPVDDLYLDWCRALFGEVASAPAAAVFAKIDGLDRYDRGQSSRVNLPVPAQWDGGPGSIKPDTLTWDQRKKDYRFVDEFEQIRPLVIGPGHHDRFDYWASTFRYLRATGQYACTWGEIARLITTVRADTVSDRSQYRQKAIDLRERQMIELQEAIRLMLETVSTNGELGTIANWQQHAMTITVTIPGHELEELLKISLPASCWPQAVTLHQDRIIIPTQRTSIRKGEDLRLKVILPQEGLTSAKIYWKAIGEKGFRMEPLVNRGRAVWYGIIRGMDIRDDIEYYVEASTTRGVQRYPAGAPDRNTTVVVY